MAFFKRLSDIINYEHWRNNKPRDGLLTEFAKNLEIEFHNLELARVHSIEFVNSLCIIKKLPPEKNVLGKRIIVGTNEHVSSGWKKLNHTVIQDFAMNINDDANLVVFELITQVAEKEQSVQALSAQVAEKEQSVQALSAQVAKKSRLYSLTTQVAENQQAMQALTVQVTSASITLRKLTAARLGRLHYYSAESASCSLLPTAAAPGYCSD